MNLSPHFTLAEFQASELAARKGIDNRMPESLIPAAVFLCQNVLEPIRDVHGPLRINSGYRSKKVNTAVGGSWNSQHTKGEAADIIPLALGVKPLDIFLWAYKHCDFDQLIWEFDGAWVHVSYSHSNRKESLRADAVPGKRRPLYSPMTDEQISALV